MKTRAALLSATAALLLASACTRNASRQEPPAYATSSQPRVPLEEEADPAAAAAPAAPLPGKEAKSPRPAPPAPARLAAGSAPASAPAESQLHATRAAKAMGNGQVSHASRLPGRRGKVGDLAEAEDYGASPEGGFNTEEYAATAENPFLSARANPLSTFSIDVDAASYANVRRFLRQNRLPPPDAVRVEEIVNYFDYGYPNPAGEAPFSITAEVAATPWNPKTRLVHVGLQGERVENARLPASNLVFLIDVSGSMDSPEKLPLLKRAFRLLVDNLRPQDRVAMVVYAGAAGEVLPPTPGSDKAAILEALDRLSAGGSTAGAAGLELAYDLARKHFVEGGNNRVILATDGDFNVGVSSEGELARLIEAKRRTGVFLSILGFGMGNYKDSRMEQLSAKGNGNYAYIDNIREARKVLVEEMGGTLVTLAKDVKIQVEFNPARVEAYRLIGYENRLLRSEDFNDDAKDAGELGAGHSVTALYEVVPAGTGMALPGVDSLKYQRPAAPAGDGEASGELLTVKFRYKDPNGSRSKLLSRALPDRAHAWREASEDFRFSAAAAGFGMLLKGSAHKGDLDWARVLELARGAVGADPEGHRAEFLRLAEAARHLSSTLRVGARGQ